MWVLLSQWPLLGVLLTFLLLVFLMTLQIMSIFLSMRTCKWSGLVRPCSWANIMAAWGPNLSYIYISCSHEAIISVPYVTCACWILWCTHLDIMHWSWVSSCGSTMFAYFALDSTFFSQASGTSMGFHLSDLKSAMTSWFLASSVSLMAEYWLCSPAQLWCLLAMAVLSNPL